MIKKQLYIASNQALLYVCQGERGALCEANFPTPIQLKYLEQSLTIHMCTYYNQRNIQEICRHSKKKKKTRG